MTNPLQPEGANLPFSGVQVVHKTQAWLANCNQDPGPGQQGPTSGQGPCQWKHPPAPGSHRHHLAHQEECPRKEGFPWAPGPWPPRAFAPICTCFWVGSSLMETDC